MIISIQQPENSVERVDNEVIVIYIMLILMVIYLMH